MATMVKLGGHSSYASTLIQALKGELGIPASTQTTDITSMMVELARVHGVAFTYDGESYGYRVQCEDERSLAFVKVFAMRHGLILTG